MQVNFIMGLLQDDRMWGDCKMMRHELTVGLWHGGRMWVNFTVVLLLDDGMWVNITMGLLWDDSMWDDSMWGYRRMVGYELTSLWGYSVCGMMGSELTYCEVTARWWDTELTYCAVDVMRVNVLWGYRKMMGHWVTITVGLLWNDEMGVNFTVVLL